MRLLCLLMPIMFAVTTGCTTARDVLAVNVAETVAAEDAEGHFNKSKLKGIDARFSGQTAVFYCRPPKCPRPVNGFFQMATLSQEEQELLAADKARGYANLAEEVSRTFILPGDGTPQSSVRSKPVLASYSGVTSLEQTVVSAIETANEPSAAQVIILADRGQSSVIITLAASREDAIEVARILKSAWRP
jgi:hypothetical protein